MSFDQDFDRMQRNMLRLATWVIIANVLFWSAVITIVVLVLSHYGIL